MGTVVTCPFENLLADFSISILYCLAVAVITLIGSSESPEMSRSRRNALCSQRSSIMVGTPDRK